MQSPCLSGQLGQVCEPKNRWSHQTYRGGSYMVQSAREGSRHRGLKVFVLLCTLMVIALPAMAAKGGSGATGGGGKGHGGKTGGTTATGTFTLRLVDATADGQPH